MPNRDTGTRSTKPCLRWGEYPPPPLLEKKPDELRDRCELIETLLKEGTPLAIDTAIQTAYELYERCIELCENDTAWPQDELTEYMIYATCIETDLLPDADDDFPWLYSENVPPWVDHALYAIEDLYEEFLTGRGDGHPPDKREWVKWILGKFPEDTAPQQ
jgi:hypothetical protein